MLVVTAKMSKKRLSAAVIALAIILCIIVVIAGNIGSKKDDVNTSAMTLDTNEKRVAYLNSCGWEIESTPIETQDIVIPKEFSDTYSKYNEIQLQQGFDLSDYCGMDATRYTYLVTNYPDCEDKVVADIIICRGQLIGGDIQSTVLNGFMHGLKFPENAA